MFTVIVKTAEDPENEDITAAGCNVKVVMAAGANSSTVNINRRI